MGRKLLDTTFLIHYWAGLDAVEAFLADTEDTAEFVTTPINLKEIAVGREIQGKYDRTEIRSTFEWIDVVPFTSEQAFVAGELEAALRRSNCSQHEINSLTADLLIAAAAKTLDTPVVTRNVNDFERLEGVTVEPY
ncbi:type II toxin-antitoxin system VapC family toxin [Salinadaptatus halalkaliphilus]|uniref:Ribonuclease VapC n=1 Tax=Salinadaptatus halalkaliphilus TaxID=2419781 RepID=A0A4S3TNW0_9EURY|nr:type II toxin-antitoxin system VapC family toxin [Salinadaptatus halalkaliphilus]THE64913.1 type II toxin-antitoxin system VapC family toxin [Salinadaptatus halalkaliphilus]